MSDHRPLVVASLLANVVVGDDRNELHRRTSSVGNRGCLLDVRMVVVVGVAAAGGFVRDRLLSKLLDKPGRELGTWDWREGNNQSVEEEDEEANKRRTLLFITS